MNILDRFKKYIAFDTKSDEKSETYPSTQSQLVFGDMLVNDLHSIGVSDAYKDEFGLVYAYVNNNKDKTIGLIAHMDTSPSMDGGCRFPQVIKNYDGGIIRLNQVYSMSPNEFPVLGRVIGDDLLVTDGEHLLGGDDKAGIAIIFAFAEYFVAHKDEFNYDLAICFTPDEEIGAGWKMFKKDRLKADVAFTLDGGSIYEASHENFNALSCKIKIKGIGVHPGSAKNIMVNACAIASLIHNNLPKDQVPEKTEGYQGYIHLTNICGDVEYAELSYEIRDHDKKLLEEKKNIILASIEKVQAEHPKAEIQCVIHDDYRNMLDYFIEHPEAVEMINRAYLKSGTPLTHTAIRGGTDGAMITYMGLPCPNLGDGDFNCHGRYEFVSITQMEKMVEILKDLFKL